jgi:hypothetical protein
MESPTLLKRHCHIAEPDLRAFLIDYGSTLAPLLGPLWPLKSYGRSIYSEEFTAYQLGQMPDGRWVKLHHFRGPDRGAPHDHPTQIHSFRIKGSYWERVYLKGGTLDVLRAEGSDHVIEPDTIHQLTSLPEGECWTLSFTGPVVREWRHYPELLA